METFGKQIENCLHQNTTYCYFQKQRKYKMKLFLKCPNFIRTIGWHPDNLMYWLVRLGSIK